MVEVHEDFTVGTVGGVPNNQQALTIAEELDVPKEISQIRLTIVMIQSTIHDMRAYREAKRERQSRGEHRRRYMIRIELQALFIFL